MLKRFIKMLVMLFAVLTIIAHTGQDVIFASEINHLEFSSIEEFLEAYIATREGRVSSDLEIARKTAHSNFASLEEIHLITNLPEAFRIDEIWISRELVSIIYVPIAKENTGDTMYNFILQVTRWTYEVLRSRGYNSPLDNLSLYSDLTEEDLIDGKYLLCEHTSSLYWEQGSNLFILRMLRAAHESNDASRLTAADLGLAADFSVSDMIRFTETVSVNMRDENSIASWSDSDFTMFDELLGRAQREPEITTAAESSDSYHSEDTAQQSEIELPDVVIPTLRFTIGSNSFLHNGTVKQSEVAPFISQERTMVPLRIIAEALNAEVDWDSTTRTIIITGRGETINLIVDVPLPGDMGTPVIVNGSTFVPVRYVSETLGATVRWDGESKAVYIYGS